MIHETPARRPGPLTVALAATVAVGAAAYVVGISGVPGELVASVIEWLAGNEALAAQHPQVAAALAMLQV